MQRSSDWLCRKQLTNVTHRIKLQLHPSWFLQSLSLSHVFLLFLEIREGLVDKGMTEFRRNSIEKSQKWVYTDLASICKYVHTYIYTIEVICSIYKLSPTTFQLKIKKTGVLCTTGRLTMGTFFTIFISTSLKDPKILSICLYLLMSLIQHKCGCFIIHMNI